jgi:hypothetical protein
MVHVSRVFIKLLAEHFNEDKRIEFECMGDGGHYSERQKEYAFELIAEHGVRATARILQIPRRTLQRWCRKYNIYVRLYPPWIHEWAERRRKRKEFWERRGYY